jgi:hypothetical protein
MTTSWLAASSTILARGRAAMSAVSILQRALPAANLLLFAAGCQSSPSAALWRRCGDSGG